MWRSRWRNQHGRKSRPPPRPSRCCRAIQTWSSSSAQRIGASGLTPDQIRARLAAAGYPPNFLDPYLSGSDTTKAVSPGGNVLEAVQLLGIMGQTDLDSLLAMTDSARAVMDSIRADSLKKAGGGLRVFGLEIFRKSNSVFLPNLGGPVDENYRLGPGDVLVLVLTGDVELAYYPRGHPGGVHRHPPGGPALRGQPDRCSRCASCSTPGSARSTPACGAARGPPRSSTSPWPRSRTNQIFVVGEVSAAPAPTRWPAPAPCSRRSTPRAASRRTASFRRIDVRRGGKLVDSLDLYDYLLRGDNSNDIRLETGDVVFVGVHEARVKATGQLVRPAIYELRPTETLRDLIYFAGGFTADALRRRVQIDRILPPSAAPARWRRARPGGHRPDLGPVHRWAGPAISDGRRRLGHRLRRGGEGQQLDHASTATSGMPGVDRLYLRHEAERRDPAGRGPQARRLPRPDPDLAAAARLDPDPAPLAPSPTRAGAVSPDLLLQEDDEITIFSRTSFRPDRYVVVTGAVLKAGRVPYTEGMTLRDAVLQVGGVTEDALLTEAQIARLPGRSGRWSAGHHDRRPLDSTYLFDRARTAATSVRPASRRRPAARRRSCSSPTTTS